jgi:hypothetical protein
MKKLLLIILFFTISCTKFNDSVETIGLLSLLDYRQKVNMTGTFMGIYDANVKVAKLNVDGKCDQNEITVGSTNGKGKFDVSFERYETEMVCIKSTPKPDGTSRFLALDTNRELTWIGDEKFNIVILPQPSTTKRSSFNSIGSPFNRMAMRRIERLSRDNTDPSKIKDLVKSANRQIVSQFGLNKSLGRSVSFQKISSVEMAIPDLNDIVFDAEDLNDANNLKFNIMIGGLHKMAIPEKPDTYNDVVKVVAEYISSGNGSSSGEDGQPLLLPRDRKENGGSGLPLSANNSLSNKVTAAVQSFVIENASQLNIPDTMISNIVSQIVVNDKPTFGPVALPSTDKPANIEYQKTNYIYTLESNVSLFPKTENVSFLYLSGILPDGLSFNANTGELSGVLSKLGKYDFVVNASGKGGDKSVKMSIEVVETPTINLTSDTNCSYKTNYYLCLYRSGNAFSIYPFFKGIDDFTFVGVKPSGLNFNTKDGSLTGIPTSMCTGDDCIIDMHGSGKGGSTNIIVKFLEIPSAVYESYYVFENDINFSISPQMVKAVKSFQLLSLLPYGLYMDENGRIYGNPIKQNTIKYKIDLKVIGDGGETIISFFLIRKPTLTYVSQTNFSLGQDFEIKPQESNGIINYIMQSTLPNDIYFDNISGRIWGKITSVFNDIWKITGVNENQQVQVSIVVSSENNYMLQCNTQNVEGLQGDSVSVFYCTSMGTNVKNWIFTGELQSGLSILSNEQNFSISGIALEGGNRNFSLQYMTDYGLSPIFNFSINIKGMPQITKKIKWTVYNNSGISGFAMSANDWDILYQRADRFYSSGEGSASKFLNWGTSLQLDIGMPQDFFGFKVEGNFVPRKTGYYTFSCTGDDATDLSINNMVICGHYGGHGAAADGAYTGTYYMETGISYSFKARMQEQTGGDALVIKWRKPGSVVWEIDENELGL